MYDAATLWIEIIMDLGPGTGYDSDDGYYYVKLDHSDFELPSTAIIAAISEIEKRPPESLEPLTNCIDADALDAIFVPQRQTVVPTGCLEFTFEGFDISVFADYRIELRPV